MHSATCSIWSREMKQKVSDETGAIHASTLADKVETVQNTASALTDLIDAQRSYRLEITIVILIAVELGIAVFDLFFRPRYGL